MARIAKTIITAEDKTKPGIQSAINNVLALDDASKKVARTLTNAFTIVGIAATARQIADFGATAYKAFAESERAVMSFSTALSERTDVSRRALEAFNTSFSRSFGVDGEAILGMETLLLASGRTEGQITKMMEAAQALSIATGKDLKSSVEQLNKTFGGTAGELGEIIPEFKSLTAEQMKSGDAVDIILGKFGHLNDTLSNTADVKMKNLANAWKDLTEAIGGSIAGFISPVVEAIGKIITAWSDAIKEMNKYKNIQKQGVNAAAQDKISNLEVDKKKILGERDATLKVAGLYDFSSWLTSIKITGLEKYNKPGSDSDPKVVAEYRMLRETFVKNDSGYKNLTKKFEDAVAEIARLQQTMKDSEAEEQRVQVAIDRLNDSVQANTAKTESAPQATLPAQSAVPSFAIPSASDLARGQSPGGTLIPAGGSESMPDILGLSGLGDGLGAITDIMGIFGDGLMSSIGSLSSVMALLDPIGTILAGVMEIIGPLIDELLAPLVEILMILGNTIGALIVPQLKFWIGVVKIVADAFVFIYNKALLPFANAIIWLNVKISNVFVDLYNGLRRLLKKVGVNIGGKMDSISYNDSKLQEISSSNVTGANAGATAGTTARTGASYTGSQAITFNFYNQGNVVGAGGLEELALLIDAILKRNARYA